MIHWPVLIRSRYKTVANPSLPPSKVEQLEPSMIHLPLKAAFFDHTQLLNVFQRADGSSGRRVTPYVIDLGSANGTFVNNQKIDARKYVEVLEKDVLKFGFSSREYVLLHDQSKESEQDDPGIE